MSIINDFTGIAAHFKDDRWWMAAKAEPVAAPAQVEPPKPTRTMVEIVNDALTRIEPIEPLYGRSPAMDAMADLRAEMERMQEEIVRVFAGTHVRPPRVLIPDPTWRKLNQPARCPKCGPLLLCAEHAAIACA